MGAFEFDLSARNCCGNNNNGAGETCIIAQKIFDQCRAEQQETCYPRGLRPRRNAAV